MLRTQEEMLEIIQKDITYYNLPIELTAAGATFKGAQLYDVFYKNRWVTLGTPYEIHAAIVMACVIKEVEEI